MISKIEANSPPERNEVAVKWDVLNHPICEGDFADVNELSAADWVLDFHYFECPVKKSVKTSVTQILTHKSIKCEFGACK